MIRGDRDPHHQSQNHETARSGFGWPCREAEIGCDLSLNAPESGRLIREWSVRNTVAVLARFISVAVLSVATGQVLHVLNVYPR